MKSATNHPSASEIERSVSIALGEDIGSGDITALLIPSDHSSTATIITREHAVLCGTAWVDEVFRQLDANIHIRWLVRDGDDVAPDQVLCELHGNSRSLLTGERTALNFLQTLSGTATTSRKYEKLVAASNLKILDTRKTIPGLRNAQKYAVACGGCHNHRMGLYDAFLIKENHIAACGSIDAAVRRAAEIAPGKPIEVEVETLIQLGEAIDSGADVVMLDNFSIEQTRRAVELAARRAKLESSGGLTETAIHHVAESGVDYVSLGLLTKHVRAVDLSMRVTDRA